MLLWIKYFINKLFSTKYKRTGNCKQCGQCCRTIIFSLNGKYVKTEKEFGELKKTDKKYNHFIPTEQDCDGILLFRCKSLTNDNKCKDYFTRSLYCRKYPNPDKKFILAQGKLLEGCGYNFTTKKNFSDYLKN